MGVKGEDEARPTFAAEYFRRIDRLEQLPEMRSGTDKSWVHRALRSWQEYFARVVKVDNRR